MYQSVAIDKIKVDRDSRQRREITDVDDLVVSFASIGQLNPIVIDEDYNLIAGERRLTAAKELGWVVIDACFFSDLSERERMRVELDENFRRKDLPWLDLCRAVYNYHQQCTADEEAWSITQTAEEIGMDRVSVTNRIEVYEQVLAGNERVREAPQYSVAVNLVSRKKERQRDSTFDLIDELVDPESSSDEDDDEEPTALGGFTDPEEQTKPKPRRRPPLKHITFEEWVQTYEGNPYNFIHCDFPYGVGADKHAQGGAKSHGGYADSFEDYEKCLDTLATACGTGIVADSAHLMFWFHMNHYAYTIDRLEKMGWKVLNMPLIWFKSDNTGILPDAARRPRYIYETALMASRGDRKLVQAVGNCYGAPSPSDKIHMSQKNEAMLAHFFRMFVDEYSRVLDPTCGSGVALRVAKRANAAHVLGLERDREFYELARDHWHGEEE